MSYLILDTTQPGLYFDQTTQLEGVEYIFTFIWSSRETAWYINISDQTGIILAPWLRLNISYPLLHRFQNPQLPPGMLVLADMTGMNEDIQVPTDLGTRVLFFYITSDDADLA